MSVLQDSVPPPRVLALRRAAPQRALMAPRFAIYISCTLLAVLTSWLIGKDMEWDTLHYHLYAGFSALHDRFGLDYFAAGEQSYLNPYIYLPFYLLATSGLTALAAATILALIQSAILWLTYELAIAVAPPERPYTRVAVGVCAVILAFANPVLISQFGSSFADITTAELVLAGCLLLMNAVRMPGAWRIAAAGALLGAASAFKLSNALPAASLAVVPLFLPVGWRKRLGHGALLGLCMGLSFALVSAPWSFRLERYFGNPFFPLLSGLFPSPQYVNGNGLDYRFVPSSLTAALWRPFAIATPSRMLHSEIPAPDPRYVILLIVGLAALVCLPVRRWMSARRAANGRRGLSEYRAELALGCAFLISWVLWLATSGNSRYFLPMACVAAVLAIAVLFRLLARWPRLRYCAVAVVLGVQICQVHAGAILRPHLPWGGPWFDFPQALADGSQPALYFSTGMQSNAFIVPFLPPGSGMIDLDGDYVLGPEGANGAHVRALIRQFSPRLRVIIFDPRSAADRRLDVPYPAVLNDALAPFGLRADTNECARIAVPGAPKFYLMTFGRAIPDLPWSKWYTAYLVVCKAVPDGETYGAVPPAERSVDRALDRLEDLCPAVLQPHRTITFRMNGAWWRRYANTSVYAWVGGGRVYVESALGGDRPHDLGPVSAWETQPPRIACGRAKSGLFFVRLAR